MTMKLSLAITGIKLHFKMYLHIVFFCIFNQINAAFVSSRGFFQNPKI